MNNCIKNLAFFLLIGCANTSVNLEDINENSIIYEKYIAFKRKNIAVETSKIEKFNGEEYIIEEKIIYDDLGIAELHSGSAEGFIIHSRNKADGFMIIQNSIHSDKILFDKKNNYILDGKDTIRSFKIYLDEKIIMTLKKNRVYVYKWKSKKKLITKKNIIESNYDDIEQKLIDKNDVVLTLTYIENTNHFYKNKK